MNADKLNSLLGRPVAIAPLPVTLRHSAAGLRREAAKAATGAAICFATVILLSPAAVIAWPLGFVGFLFLAYLGEQWRRRRIGYELDAAGVAYAGGGRRRRIDWARLDDLRLNFYPRRRRSQQGTLVLVLRAQKTKLKLDSTLDHFPTALLHAAGAARERNLQPEPTTAANLSQIGL